MKVKDDHQLNLRIGMALYSYFQSYLSEDI